MSPVRLSLLSHRTILIGGVLLVLFVIVGVTAFTALGATPEAVTNPNYPFPTDAHLDPTKANIVHRDATARITAATQFARNPPTRDPNTATPFPTVIHPISRTGIIPGPLPGEDDFPFRHDATVENFYRIFLDNRIFVVAAGATQTDPLQGFVGVAAYNKTGLQPLNKSLTPTKHGSVHITAVNGSLVTLVAVDGTMFVFDDTTYTFK